MPHNGMAHAYDPDGANYTQSNVTLATTSIGSGVVAGTLAAVDAASGPTLEALSGQAALAAPALAGIPIPSFMTLGFVTQGSLDLWIFVFAFVSVGLASANLYLGFWLKRRESVAHATALELMDAELHELREKIEAAGKETPKVETPTVVPPDRPPVREEEHAGHGHGHEHGHGHVHVHEARPGAVPIRKT
jgi:hypothetical protein